MIQTYKESTYWMFDTKLILLIPSYSDPAPFEAILRRLSAAGIINAAILHINFSGTYFVYHNPYLHSDSAIVYLRNPTDWRAAFPNKLENLNGFQLNLVAVNNPPGVILKGKNVLGIQSCLWKMVLKKWNATHRYEVWDYLRRNPNNSVLTDLFINRLHFNSVIGEGYELLPANTQDVIRVIIRDKGSLNVFHAIRKYLLNSYIILLYSTFFAYIVLYYILFYRKSPVFCMTGWKLIPILMRQPVFIKLKFSREKIFIIGGVWFGFFTTSIYECYFTSNVILNLPGEKLKSISDLTSKNIKIFTDPFLFSVLHNDQYNLSRNFLNRLQVVDAFPWTQEYFESEYAYVIGIKSNGYLFKSASKIDYSSDGRYYMLEEAITTIPTVYPFLPNSPYTSQFRILVHQVYEAGIRQYCQTTTFRKDVWSLWSYFKAPERHELQMYTQISQFQWGFLLLLIGWLTSILCLCVELLLNRSQKNLNRRAIKCCMIFIGGKIRKIISSRSKKIKRKRTHRPI